jgi:hypothetical protein
LHVSGKWDGEINSYAMHVICVEIRRALEKYIRDNNYYQSHYLCDCIGLGELGDALKEYCREVLEYDPYTGVSLKRNRPTAMLSSVW